MHCVTSATAADYGWIRSSSSPFRYALEIGYTLALVRGVSPAELLTLAGAEPRGVCVGLGELIEQHQELIDESDDRDECVLAGACTVQSEQGDWTLALALGGDLGSPGFMETLSAGSRAVSHSSNGGKPMHFFHWHENGELRTTFEWPTVRSGSTPDELNAVMREVGFDLTDEEAPDVDGKAAVFALTERLTGVRVTEKVLMAAEYRAGEVPEESGEEWESITIDITDAYGERTYVHVRKDQL
ncbi:DUF6461 domain-containing protein [Streptomyces sp. NPDC007095]|uniref:DUF6461 domain-containing protein n=1 Tax=Streptomyces sp. NPDC007095 TaxID=3154482 RepID=UPI0033EEDBB8